MIQSREAIKLKSLFAYFERYVVCGMWLYFNTPV